MHTASASTAGVVVGLRPKGPLWFFRSLPRTCIGFLFAVLCDVFVMVAYGSVLIATGLGSSSFYFASLILAATATLVYFSISAIRSENTVELLAAVAISSCVNATVVYFRVNENAFTPVQRRGSNVFSSIDILPPEVLDAGILAWTAFVQIALVSFGYLSYHDFGWRIFKLFGIDFNMRQVYERFLWFMAMLKLDTLMALLNVAAGFGAWPALLPACRDNHTWSAPCECTGLSPVLRRASQPFSSNTSSACSSTHSWSWASWATHCGWFAASSP